LKEEKKEKRKEKEKKRDPPHMRARESGRIPLWAVLI
jgi:hypothetical protein